MLPDWSTFRKPRWGLDRSCEAVTSRCNATGIAPQNKVHVLVIPKGPYSNFMHFNANASDAEKLGLLDAIGQTAIIMGVNESGFRLLSNTGQHGRQTVPHLHVHLRGGEPVD
jgi:diadenosine tetraphosphate (Ap4A) HIT family hydrolase